MYLKKTIAIFTMIALLFSMSCNGFALSFKPVDAPVVKPPVQAVKPPVKVKTSDGTEVTVHYPGKSKGISITGINVKKINETGLKSNANANDRSIFEVGPSKPMIDIPNVNSIRAVRVPTNHSVSVKPIIETKNAIQKINTSKSVSPFVNSKPSNFSLVTNKIRGVAQHDDVFLINKVPIHGEKRIELIDGSQIIGNFYNGKLIGKFEKEWKVGSSEYWSFAGYVYQNKYTGKMKRTWSDGTKLELELVSDQPNGEFFVEIFTHRFEGTIKDGIWDIDYQPLPGKNPDKLDQDLSIFRFKKLIQSKAYQFDFSTMTQEEYAKWLVANDSASFLGMKGNGEAQERLLYDFLTIKPFFRMDRMLNQIMLRVTDSMENQMNNWIQQFPEKLKMISKSKNIEKIMTTKDNSWIRFSVNKDLNNNASSIPKLYVTFSDWVQQVDVDTFALFLQKLQKQGFNGQIKFPTSASRIITRMDNLVIHGNNQSEIDLVEKVVKEVFSGEYRLQRGSDPIGIDSNGVDQTGLSHTMLLAKQTWLQMKNKQ